MNGAGVQARSPFLGSRPAWEREKRVSCGRSQSEWDQVKAHSASVIAAQSTSTSGM